MDTFDLFYHQCRRDLICAVPEGWEIPPFVSSERWTFCGKVEPDADPPTGFDPRAATVGVHLNGFHLYQATGRS